MNATVCSHVAEHLKKVKPQSKGCEECLKIGDRWLHLRMCLECGTWLLRLVEEPARAGAFPRDEASADPIRRAREDWKWCYIDEVYL